MNNIRHIVIEHAIESELISNEDLINNTRDFQWLHNEVKKRVQLLRFLIQAAEEDHSHEDLNAVSSSINSKVETIVKQIILEINQSKKQFSSFSSQQKS